MNIPYTDMGALKRAYIEEKNRIREAGGSIKEVKLTYQVPTALHYSKRIRDDKTELWHTVRGLFFLKNGTCNCEHEPETVPDMVCYSTKRQKTTGYPLPMYRLLSVEIIPMTEAEKPDYGKEWQAIADSMKRHQINPDAVRAIERHLRGETEHIEGYQMYWKRTDKPRTMSFSDVLDRFTPVVPIPENVSIPYAEHKRAELKALQSVVIEELKKRATKSEYGEYMYHHVTRNGMKRDRSVSVQVYPDGKVRYYAASEYAGTGNGDYYEMYSPTMAVYVESD